jgi:hypothetical protein
MQGLLREMNKKKWIQKKRPFITPAHATARLEWAIRHQAYTLNDWMKVSWSDECTIERGVGIKPIWTFTRPRDQARERYTTRPVLGERSKADVLGCF